MQRLKEAAEKAKIELSGMSTTNVNLPFITVVDGAPSTSISTFPNRNFDNLTSDLVDRTVEPMRKAMQDAGLKLQRYNKVYWSAGSTRIPAVFEKLKALPARNLSRASPRRMRRNRCGNTGRRASAM